MGSFHEANSDRIKSKKKIFTTQSRQYKLKIKRKLSKMKVNEQRIYVLALDQCQRDR